MSLSPELMQPSNSFVTPEKPSWQLVTPQLRRYPRGLDLVNGINTPHGKNNGVIYEEQCFEILTGRLPNNEVAIGPHLFDRAIAFGGNRLVVFARPDALTFQQYGDTLVLREMSEFKSRKKNGHSALMDKISAFPNLLDHFRLYPDLLPGLLNTASDHRTDFKKMIIPPNFDISVFVMSAHEYPLQVASLPFETRFEQYTLRT